MFPDMQTDVSTVKINFALSYKKQLEIPKSKKTLGKILFIGHYGMCVHCCYLTVLISYYLIIIIIISYWLMMPE